MTTNNRNPYESSLPKSCVTREVYTIIEKFPGDLPHESHSASGYFESFSDASDFLNEWRESDPSVKVRKLSITSRDI